MTLFCSETVDFKQSEGAGNLHKESYQDSVSELVLAHFVLVGPHEFLAAEKELSEDGNVKIMFMTGKLDYAIRECRK